MESPNKRWRRSHPEAARAHWQVQEAIRSGRLTQQPCEICNQAHAHAHHDDYEKPLEVRWLCARCHRQLHARAQGQETHDGDFYTRKPVYRPHHQKFQPAPQREALIGQAQALRADGRSYRQIARQLGVSIGTTYKWLNEVLYN